MTSPYGQIGRAGWFNVRVTDSRSDQPRNSTHEVSGDHVTMQWYSNITKIVTKTFKSAPIVDYSKGTFSGIARPETESNRSVRVWSPALVRFDSLCYSPSKRWTDLGRDAFNRVRSCLLKGAVIY